MTALTCQFLLFYCSLQLVSSATLLIRRTFNHIPFYFFLPFFPEAFTLSFKVVTLILIIAPAPYLLLFVVLCVMNITEYFLKELLIFLKRMVIYLKRYMLNPCFPETNPQMHSFKSVIPVVQNWEGKGNNLGHAFSFRFVTIRLVFIAAFFGCFLVSHRCCTKRA